MKHYIRQRKNAKENNEKDSKILEQTRVIKASNPITSDSTYFLVHLQYYYLIYFFNLVLFNYYLTTLIFAYSFGVENIPFTSKN